MLLKLPNADRSSAAEQLRYDNHPLFEGLHPLPTNMKIFYNKVLFVESNILEACTTHGSHSRRLYWAGFGMPLLSLRGKLPCRFRGRQLFRWKMQWKLQGVRESRLNGSSGITKSLLPKDPKGPGSPKACSQCGRNKRADKGPVEVEMWGEMRQIESTMIEQRMDLTSSEDFVVQFFSSST